MLIANRGEIARRVARSCRQLGLEPVMVYTQPDALSLHVLDATSKVCLGESTREYTNAAKLVEVAVQERQALSQKPLEKLTFTMRQKTTGFNSSQCTLRAQYYRRTGMKI